ncbi:hypothetical protein ACP70R_029538 [Stipagrostis hirtigluma subsp. patula]
MRVHECLFSFRFGNSRIPGSCSSMVIWKKQQRSTMPPSDLVDDVLTEIFLRLPPESILCLRAVSKQWRRITTGPTFVAAYSRRRPLELLTYPDGCRLERGAKNVLAAVDPAASGDAGRRRLLRFDGQLHLVDSRDGLLLFADGERSFLICNPATRQWASLPSLAPEIMCVAAGFVPSGLYIHRPSGEHRVLCIGGPPPRSSGPYVAAFHYILPTGAAEPRRLGPVAGGREYGPYPSVCLSLGGTLHWSRHPEAGDSGKMVAFDTVSETFRLIPRPPSTDRHRLRLFEIDGTLAASAVPEGPTPAHMDVWALEDGDNGGEMWTCRARIDLLPPPPRYDPWYSYPSEAVVPLLDGDVLVVVGSDWVVLYDMKAKRTVRRVDCRRSIENSSRLLYRASLVPLPKPGEQPCRRPGPGGEQLLQCCSADDPFVLWNGKA